MEKQAVCILCHNKPEQINYLIEHMPAQYFDFFIHVDLKSDIINQIDEKENVFFSKRINVQWGQFSQVEATLELLKIVQTEKYIYVHLISGNDYIIKPVSEVRSFFMQNKKEYIQSNRLPVPSSWSWDGKDRYECWYPQWIIKRPNKKFYRYLRVAYREFIMRTKFLKRRKYPVNNFFGGGQWFSLTGECVEWMKNYLVAHPEYVNFFKHGVCVDEVFFSTLIQYSPFKENIENNNLRFMIWKGTNSGGPKELQITDIPQMKESNCIFARKITDISVIRHIQKELCE